MGYTTALPCFQYSVTSASVLRSVAETSAESVVMTVFRLRCGGWFSRADQR